VRCKLHWQTTYGNASHRQRLRQILLLIHSIGSSHRSWNLIIDTLALQREVNVIDLPGFGNTKPLSYEVSLCSLADAVTRF
jgi:pimeloyl-ACP methyl ester carboxylesterase